jgi:hypothetical protein
MLIKINQYYLKTAVLIVFDEICSLDGDLRVVRFVLNFVFKLIKSCSFRKKIRRIFGTARLLATVPLNDKIAEF